MNSNMRWRVRCTDCGLWEERASRLAAGRLAAAHRRDGTHEVRVDPSRA